MNKIRTFIAFRVADKAKEELLGVQAQLRGYNRKAHVGWSKSRGWHVTVEFLGEISPAKVEEVKNILLYIARDFHKFDFWLANLDGFPNKANPNVIIVKVGEEHRVSASLQEKLSKELRAIGLGHDDHPWTPHITLARNKAHERIAGLNTIKVQPVVWEVSSIELIKSDLQPNGPKYTILESY